MTSDVGEIQLSERMELSVDQKWWKNGTVYQIYPASYKDSDGDGVGDIPGILNTLDYLKDLGIDIIWLSPMYDSPQVDMGYDISDYENIYPPYGTMADMEALILGCHDRGMRLVVDLVINHTSDLHSWFRESRSSKHNPKRDWYIWRPAQYDGDGKRKPPNNWRSMFGGSVWEWDDTTQEYYLHLFAPEQPDLNWENETTRKAIYETAMEFWLQKGIDGFRADTANMYSKLASLPDAPVVDLDSDWQNATACYCNGPRMNEFLEEMNDQVLSRYDCMTVGELPHTLDQKRVLEYVSASKKHFNMVFQFEAVEIGKASDHKYDTTPFAYTLPEFKAAIMLPQELIDGTDAWTTVFLENHDQARSISRFGSDDPKYRRTSGKMLAIMLAALSGTLFLYQGQEIGMINCPKDWPMDEYKDVESKNYYDMVKERSGNDPKALLGAQTALQHLSRDQARLPMQWNDSINAGFSTGKPWMRVHDNHTELNVEKEARDEDSLLNFWKKALAIRKSNAGVLIHGRTLLYDADNPSTYTFVKQFGGKSALVILNFTSSPQPMARPLDLKGTMKCLLCNLETSIEDTLGPWEGRLYIVE